MDFISEKVGSIINKKNKEDEEDDDHVALDDVDHVRIRADSSASSDVHSMIAMIQANSVSSAPASQPVTARDPLSGIAEITDEDNNDNYADNDDGVGASRFDENADDDDAADETDARNRLPADVLAAQAQAQALDIGPEIDEDDEEALYHLSDWLVNHVEILPSLVRKYCRLFITAGVATIPRLAKKIAKDDSFLIMHGVNVDDAEEIVSAMKREGIFDDIAALSQGASCSGASTGPGISTSAAEAIALINSNASTTAVAAAHNNTSSAPSTPFSSNTIPSIVPTMTPPSHEPRIETRLSRGNSFSGFAPPMLASLQGLGDTEGPKKRYRARTIDQEKFKDLLAESTSTVENLKTAIEGNMEVAVVGVLNNIVTTLDGSADRQRALYKAGAGPVVVSAMHAMGASAAVCERTLQVIALLCRHSDENKGSYSAENAKAIGLAGVSELLVAALTKHVTGKDHGVLEMACDTIRCLCVLESNRVRLGDAGACEAMVRSLVKFTSNAELSSWICRAIGHLANKNEVNCERFGSAGACENVMLVLQRHPGSFEVTTEVCWAIRHLAPTEDNRNRFANEFGPESITAVLKTHVASEVFVKEACLAMTACISEEDDDLVPRIANAGTIQLVLKGLKRNPDSEVLAMCVFNLLYYVACDVRLVGKLISCDILEALVSNMENHASFEGLAEWACRIVHKLTKADGVSSRMRAAGLCEMTVSTVQRQALSGTVCGYGCLAIGDLASDLSNQSRLSTAGACEASVGALRRHDRIPEVVVQSCYAIHFLCLTQNNVSWMGANGGCEAVTNALNKHIESSADVTQSAVRALGSLANKDEGNQLRLKAAGACSAVVTALRTHGQDPLVAEYACRATFNMCAEHTNVSEFGAKGVCGLVVAAMQSHSTSIGVLAQACMAIYTLAVKKKNDKVHNGNTRKLVAKGAIDCVVGAMKKFPDEATIQGAGAMAMASLGRLEVNRNRLGEAGACDLVLTGLDAHSTNAKVVSKMALAIDVLAQSSDQHKLKFAAGEAVEMLLNALTKHEKSAAVVSQALRALITLGSQDSSRNKIQTELAIKQYIRAMKVHEKNELVARYACNMVYTLATNDSIRSRLGAAKACESIIAVLKVHGVTSAAVAALGCKAVVGLSTLDVNKARFHTSEACAAVVHALKAHADDLIVAEWGCAAVVSLSTHEPNRVKLGAAGVCAAVVGALTQQANNDVVVRLGCEAMYEACLDEGNRHLMGIVGGCEALVQLLNIHAANAAVCQQCCRAIAGLARNNLDSSTKLGALGACELVGTALRTHYFSVPLVEWACGATAALADKNEKNQGIITGSGMCDLIVMAIGNHRNNASVCLHATRAVRCITMNNDYSRVTFGATSVVQTTLQALRAHKEIDVIVENCCWILGNIAIIFNASNSTKSVTSTDTSVRDAVYANRTHWDLLVNCLETHCSKDQPVRWLCAAIGTFADFGKLSHPACCDAVMTALSKHGDKDTVAQRILYAVGSLSACHSENQQRLSRSHAIEIIDTICSKSMEGEAICHGSYRAIAGLAANSTENQSRFSHLPKLLKTLVKSLYHELDAEPCSRWGCLAISALAYKHNSNQAKLGYAGNFLADIISTHHGTPETVRAACEAISVLAHCNGVNRNRLGASDACEQVAKVLTYYVENDYVSNWAVRAVADLAANNVNNQSRLGAAGVCEALVMLLNRRRSPDVPPAGVELALTAAGSPASRKVSFSNSGEQPSPSSFMMEVPLAADATYAPDDMTPEEYLRLLEEDAVMARWVCWAIGNLVQLSKNNALLADDSPIIASGSTKSAGTGNNNSNSNINVSAAATGTATGANANASASESNNNPSPSRASLRMPPVGSIVGGLTAGFNGNGSSSNILGLGPSNSNSNSANHHGKKNTSRFSVAGVATAIVAVLRKHRENPTVVIWACRALNNLSQSKALKTKLNEAGAGDVVYRLLLKYHGRKEVTEWAVLARDSLTSATSISTANGGAGSGGGSGGLKNDGSGTTGTGGAGGNSGGTHHSMFDDSHVSVMMGKKKSDRNMFLSEH